MLHSNPNRLELTPSYTTIVLQNPSLPLFPSPKLPLQTFFYSAALYIPCSLAQWVSCILHSCVRTVLGSMGYSGGFRPLRYSDRPPVFCHSCGRLNGLCGSFHPWLWCILQRKSAEGRKKETIKIIVKQEKYSEHISNNLITKPKEESVYNSVLYTCILVKNRLKDIRIGLGNVQWRWRSDWNGGNISHRRFTHQFLSNPYISNK